MSRYKPKTPPSTGLESDAAPPPVRTRAQILAEFEEGQRRKTEGEPGDDAPGAPAGSGQGAPPAGVALPTQQNASASLDVLLPAPTDPPSQIIAGCERIILAANIELKETERKAVSAWMGKVGPAVRLVHSTKAYKETLDAKGKPYRSFARWAQERGGISRPHAYRMVNEGPVADALAALQSGALSTRQVDVLAPVLRQHGKDAVRHLWATAEAAGSTGHVQLTVTRDALKLSTGPEDYEPAPEPEAPSTALVRVHRAAQDMDRDRLRQAALSDPDAARRAVETARRFADELQAVLAEIAAGGSGG